MKYQTRDTGKTDGTSTPVPQNVLDLVQGVLLPFRDRVSWERVYNAIISDENTVLVQDRFLSTEELCELLHISRPTVHRYMKAGKLKAHKLGRRNLYSLMEVQDALKGGCK